MFEFIKYYFEIGLYTKDNLATFKSAAMITADQYDQLVNAVAA
ncbi:XkdX family protein [Lactiplantibacillus plantarum]|nr:XkdX family protein [Lactiplantibacillus plantarum]QGX69522.1 XkdX family protein [Lactiplantibacillus plantarum]